MINVDLNNINFMMYDFFLTLKIPFKCGRINMWSDADKYAYVPNFKFKFLNIDKDHYNYKKLTSLVKKFEGDLKWEITTENNQTNFILKPVILENDLVNNYEKLIDYSINDIPNLVVFLTKNWTYEE